MDLRPISDNQKGQYNKLVNHVMQSWQWGEFRKSLGTKVLRYGLFDNQKLISAFQLTIHQIPIIKMNVGYLPKGPFPDEHLAKALKQIASEQNCAFVKIEPDTIDNKQSLRSGDLGQLKIDNSFRKSPKPLFTKYNFIIDLTKSETELLKVMHPKTRYNIKVSQKHGVIVEEGTSDRAFDNFLKLHFETTRRQGFYSHSQNYHKKAWQVLREANMARVLTASYENSPLTTWMLFNFKDTLYYPYGGSSKSHPEVMANNLVAWEAVKLGQKLGLKKFDMWGALGPTPEKNDPWIGFHNFKKGYGGDLVEYIGTYDLILNWPVYILFNFIDKLMPLKVFLLKILGK